MGMGNYCLCSGKPGCWGCGDRSLRRQGQTVHHPKLGQGAPSPRSMGCGGLSRDIALARRCWSAVRGPLCLCAHASRAGSQTLGSPGFSCCPTQELTFGLTGTDSSAMHTSGHVPRSFCSLRDAGLNPASLACQLCDLSPVAALGGSLSSSVR